MQFVSGGPDFPPVLLQALERGELVLFCGAGVSYGLGLPGFQGLVDRVYRRLNVDRSASEEADYQLRLYDRVLGGLERRIDRRAVRGAVQAELVIRPRANLGLHRALVSLARDQSSGRVRLVTTNFDRAFARVARREGIAFHAAPFVPIPKRSRWDSIVHLHGLIDESDPEGESLIFTTSDFGSAYLTEGWASRFLAELFRGFTVLFVGYSIDDPVLRYMLDAFTVDRSRGESVKEAYALVSSTDGKAAEEDIRSWKAKGVIPILYDPVDQHSSLRRSLVRLGDVHKEGLLGREGIVKHYSVSIPVKPYGEYVSQVAWAIQESSGRVARVFAAAEAAPSLAWLDAFQEFGVFDPRDHELKPRTALLVAPIAPGDGSRLDPIQVALIPWLVEQIHNPLLLKWVVTRGAAMHPDLREQIRRRLGMCSPLPQRLCNAWRLLSGQNFRSYLAETRSIFELAESIKSQGWSAAFALELSRFLSPSIEMRWLANEEGAGDIEESFVEVGVRLNGADSFDELDNEISQSVRTAQHQWELADLLTTSLKDVFDILASMGEVCSTEDRSYYERPSIGEHEQNHNYPDWTKLIDLIRRLTEQLSASPVHCEALVRRWLSIDYPIFKRLAFFAAATTGVFPPEEQVALILRDRNWWLWSMFSGRESFALLCTAWERSNRENRRRLTRAILGGPPRAMYRDKLSRTEWRQTRDYEIWRRLARINALGTGLIARGRVELRRLVREIPGAIMKADERIEFVSWSETLSGIDTDYTSDDLLKMRPSDLQSTLIDHQHNREGLLDQWRVMTGRRPRRAIAVLLSLADQKIWNGEIWRSAMIGLKEEEGRGRGFRYLQKAVLAIPEGDLAGIVGVIATWLRESTSKLDVRSEAAYFQVWDKLFIAATNVNVEKLNDPVLQALNHPAGVLAGAMLDRLWARRPKVGEGLPEEFRSRFEQMISGESNAHVLSRVILASRLDSLFALDREWSRRALLRHIRWSDSATTRALWAGYLWTGQISAGLLGDLHEELLRGVTDVSEGEKYAPRIAELLVVGALAFPEEIRRSKLRAALREASPKTREQAARTLAVSMQRAKNGEAYWRERVGPFIDQAWPRDRALASGAASRELSRIVIETGHAFSDAVDLIVPILSPVKDWGYVALQLSKTTAPDRFPQAALNLLDATFDRDGYSARQEARQTIERIVTARPQVRRTVKYRRLDTYLRQHDL